MTLRLRLAAYGTLAASLALLLVLLHQAWPRVGSDLSYFLPRLVDVHLHYLCNGISLQWWTPSFGGGLPAFPNPQHTQFMLAQFLLPFTDPWTAGVLNLLLPLSLGYLLVLKFCREYMSWSFGAALLAAAAFATNNFSVNHGFVGHLGYASFPLVAVLPFCLHRRLQPLTSMAVLAIAGTTIVVSGGYAIVVVYALTALLLALGFALYDRAAFSPGRSLAVLAGGALLTAVAAAAKVCAVALFMRQFPREIGDSQSGQDWLHAWLSVPGHLALPKAAYLLNRLMGVDTSALLGSWAGGGHETDLGLSPAILLLVPVGTFAWMHRWTGRHAWWLALALSCAIWVTCDLAMGRGRLGPGLHALPILRELHESARMGSAFILPLILLTGLGAHYFLERMSDRLGTALVCVGVAVTLGSLLQFRRQMNGQPYSGFDASEIQRDWKAVQQGERWRPITVMADLRADQVFAARASNLRPYEPIFGYGYPGQSFKTRLQPGPILTTGESRSANFNYPLALYAPRLAGQEPFAPIPAAQKAQLRLLLDRRQPAWPHPAVQTAADITSALGMAGIVAALFVGWRCGRPAAHVV